MKIVDIKSKSKSKVKELLELTLTTPYDRKTKEKIKEQLDKYQ